MELARRHQRAAILGGIALSLIGLLAAVLDRCERPQEVGAPPLASMVDAYLVVECHTLEVFASGTRACRTSEGWIGMLPDVEALGHDRFAGILRRGQRVQDASPRAELPVGVAYPDVHLAPRRAVPWWLAPGSLVLLLVVIAMAISRRPR